MKKLFLTSVSIFSFFLVTNIYSMRPARRVGLRRPVVNAFDLMMNNAERGAGNLPDNIPANNADDGQRQANRKSISELACKVGALPFTISSKAVNFLNKSTTNVEPVTEVFKRCLIEGVLAGALIAFSNSKWVSEAAGRRSTLAEFAWDDVFSKTPTHYSDSRLFVMISGLWYLSASLGISGLQLGAWGLGFLVGLRLAYDCLWTLPKSALFSKSEDKKPNPWFFRPNEY